MVVLGAAAFQRGALPVVPWNVPPSVPAYPAHYTLLVHYAVRKRAAQAQPNFLAIRDGFPRGALRRQVCVLQGYRKRL